MTELAAPWGKSFFGEYTSVAEKWGDGHLSVGDITAPVGAGLDLLGAFVDPVKWIVGNLLDHCGRKAGPEFLHGGVRR